MNNQQFENEKYAFNFLPKFHFSKDCPICLEDFNHNDHKAVVLNCGHLICAPCLNDMLEANKKKVETFLYCGNLKDQCPLCRDEFIEKPKETVVIAQPINIVNSNVVINNTTSSTRTSSARITLTDRTLVFPTPFIINNTYPIRKTNVVFAVVKRKQRNNNNARSGSQIDKQYILPYLALNPEEPSLQYQYRFQSKRKLMKFLSDPSHTSPWILKTEKVRINPNYQDNASHHEYFNHESAENGSF